MKESDWERMEQFNDWDWLNLEGFHDYKETEPLIERPPAPVPTPPSKRKEILSFFMPTIIALSLALLLRGFVFTNIRVPTGSMEQTIVAGSRLLGSKTAYWFEEPQRYDVIIFKYPDDETQEYVKRIIGLPGEKVEIRDGLVYINDSKLPLRDDFVTVSPPTGNYGPYYVPEDSYFMLGDNREHSSDSRAWDNTFVSRDKIIAKVTYAYYPEWKKIKS